MDQTARSLVSSRRSRAWLLALSSGALAVLWVSAGGAAVRADPPAPAAAAKPPADAAAAKPPADAAAAAKPPAGAAAAAKPATATPPAAAPVVKSSVTVIVEGFRSDAGDALLALYRSKEGFPEQPLRAAGRALAHIAQRRTEVTFPKLDAGEFAITVMHDEDRNRKLKTGLFGIPSEGVGFSRNALGTFGPPSWDDAKMKLNPAVHLTIKLRMHYY
jgi:uncharacterized protein (DUF2141 family)